MGEDNEDPPTAVGDGAAIPDPEQIEAFRAFRRPVTPADQTLPDDVVGSLRPELDPSLGRCVYSGPEGKAYILPGPGSICFIAIGEAFGTTQGETTTALAADGGQGFVGSMRGKPVTFVGVLPAGGHHLQIVDRAGRASAVPLNADDGYWLEISDPVTLFLIRPNGTKREIPFHDVNRQQGAMWSRKWTKTCPEAQWRPPPSAPASTVASTGSGSRGRRPTLATNEERRGRWAGAPAFR